MAQQHRAAVLPHKGGPLKITYRSTPEPGSNEILIQVKAVALNPVDYAQRDFGMPPVPSYPAVVGSDVAGLVAKVGSGVSNMLQPGSRVIAFASSFYQGGSPDYGACQEYVLAQAEGVTLLPDALSFEQGAIFPLAVLTALSGWKTIGIPIDSKFTPEEKQAVLIWGGASSVGTFAVQSAKILGLTVYATASTKNHKYLKSLGADAVFDYNAADVVSKVVSHVGQDGVTLQMAYCAAEGSLQPTLDVLEKTKGNAVAKVAYAPPLHPGAPTLEGVDIKFIMSPRDPVERNNHIYKCFNVWLRKGLDSATVVPSPRIQVETGGLEGLNKALDLLKAGVSATKLVVTI